MGRLIYNCCNLQNNLGKVSGVTKAKIYVTEGLVLVTSPKITAYSLSSVSFGQWQRKPSASAKR